MSQISIVVAMNKDNIIGVNNQLPWHIPEDLAHFKQVTYGKPIIMGRKTFESIGRVLPGRKNIIISRQSTLHINEATVYPNLMDAITANQDDPEICIIGGGEIFKLALPIANKMYLTIVEYPVDTKSGGVTYFENLDLLKWNLVENTTQICRDNIVCHFNTYLKR